MKKMTAMFAFASCFAGNDNAPECIKLWTRATVAEYSVPSEKEGSDASYTRTVYVWGQYTKYNDWKNGADYVVVERGDSRFEKLWQDFQAAQEKRINTSWYQCVFKRYPYSVS